MNTTHYSSCTSNSGHRIPETPDWVSNGGFVPLILGIIAMFWGLAFICEEYCVPSITVFCKRNRISDDIAGAIFIGTGLSLPVLFASFVGLFISHSAIGVGTVVGGDAFNHLVNIALSIHVAPDKTLKLDAVIFTRESFFYILSCFFVIWAVEYKNVTLAIYQMRDIRQWTNCMSVPWRNSAVLIACYIVYCVFDSYFQRILDVIHKYTRKSTSPSRDLLSLHPHAMTVDTTAAGVYVEQVSHSENDIAHASSLASEVLAGPTNLPNNNNNNNSQSTTTIQNTRRKSNPETLIVEERKKTNYQLSSNHGDKTKKLVVLQYSNISQGQNEEEDEEVVELEVEEEDEEIDLEFNNPNDTLSHFMLGDDSNMTRKNGVNTSGNVNNNNNNSKGKQNNTRQATHSHNNSHNHTNNKKFVAPRVYSPSSNLNSYNNINNNNTNTDNDTYITNNTNNTNTSSTRHYDTNTIIRFSNDECDDFSVQSSGSTVLSNHTNSSSRNNKNNFNHDNNYSNFINDSSTIGSNSIQMTSMQQFDEFVPAQMNTQMFSFGSGSSNTNSNNYKNKTQKSSPQTHKNTRQNIKQLQEQKQNDIETHMRAEQVVDHNMSHNHMTNNNKKKNISPNGNNNDDELFGSGLVLRSGFTSVTSYLDRTRPGEQVEAGEYRIDYGDFQMYLKSTFYASNDFGCIPSSRKWKLRYFSFDENGLRYRLESHLSLLGAHVRFIDIFDLESVTILDANLFEFSIRLRTGNKKYYFRAPDSTTFKGVLRRLRAFIEEWKAKSEGERTAMALKSIYEISNGFDAGLVNPDSECVADDLFVLPSNPFSKAFYLLMFPQKYAIYLTVPDVRRPGSEDKAILAISLCVVWLAFQSYLLIMSLTLIGDWLGIRGRIMGLTVGAWAASYPALWSSIVVARNGYGDVASCNALGSNVFSNYIGLGLPWLVYSLVYRGAPYDKLQDDGVVLSILLMVMIMVAYYIMVALSGWTLRAWMVPVMMSTYFAFIGYLIYVMWEI